MTVRLPVERHYAGKAHLARAMERVLTEAAERGYPLPALVRVDAALFVRRGRKVRSRPALADYSTGAIYINPESYAFRSARSIRKYARRYHAKGYASSDHPDHILRHELAHLVHAREAGIPYIEDLEDHSLETAELEIAARVSRRAASSPTELVAEVFAGAWDGREYDDEVMRLYRRYRGPRL